MRPVHGSTMAGNEWTEWTCPRCLHVERTKWAPTMYEWERLNREARM